MRFTNRALASYGGAASGLLVAEMGCRGASFLLFVILARFGSLTTVGDFAIASAVATACVVVIDLGLNHRVATFVGRSPSQASLVVGATLRKKLLLFPVFLVVSYAVLVVLKGDEWTDYFLLLFIQVLAFSLLEMGGVFDAGLRGIGKVVLVPRARWTRVTLISFGSVVVAIQPTAEVAAAVFAVGGLGDFVVLAFFWRRHGRGRPRGASVHLMPMSDLAPFAWLTVGVGIYARLDQLILGALLPPTALAVYAGAYKFYDVLLLVPQVFARSHIAAIVGGSWANATATARRSALLCGIVALLLPVYFWVPSAVLGEDYDEANSVLAVLAVSLPATAASSVLLSRLLSDRRTRWVPAAVSVCQVVLNGIVVVLLVPLLGILGAAAAVVGVEVINPVAYLIIKRHLDARV